jgi:hypothetical protein
VLDYLSGQDDVEVHARKTITYRQFGQIGCGKIAVTVLSENFYSLG